MAQTLAQFAEFSPDPAYEWRVRADAIEGSCWRGEGYVKMKTIPQLKILLQEAMDAESVGDTISGDIVIQHDYLYFNSVGFDIPHDLVRGFSAGFDLGFE